MIVHGIMTLISKSTGGKLKTGQSEKEEKG